MYTVYLVIIHLLAIIGTVLSITHLRFYLASKRMIKEFERDFGDIINNGELEELFKELDLDKDDE